MSTTDRLVSQWNVSLHSPVRLPEFGTLVLRAYECPNAQVHRESECEKFQIPPILPASIGGFPTVYWWNFAATELLTLHVSAHLRRIHRYMFELALFVTVHG